jgi:hypothetical protein
MAIIHIAMFDAENAITKKFVSYSGIPAVQGNVSQDRAIAQAAHDTLVALYPSQKERLDAIFDADIVRIPGSPAAIDCWRRAGNASCWRDSRVAVDDGSALPGPRCFDFFPYWFSRPNVSPAFGKLTRSAT